MAPIYNFLFTLKTMLTEEREKGATAVEYALIIAVVSIGLIVALEALNLTTIIAAIQDFLDNAI